MLNIFRETLDHIKEVLIEFINNIKNKKSIVATATNLIINIVLVVFELLEKIIKILVQWYYKNKERKRNCKDMSKNKDENPWESVYSIVILINLIVVLWVGFGKSGTF
jgi:SNF family Na+-dependent transporter